MVVPPYFRGERKLANTWKKKRNTKKTKRSKNYRKTRNIQFTTRKGKNDGQSILEDVVNAKDCLSKTLSRDAKETASKKHRYIVGCTVWNRIR